jgi:hypothetical protein
MAVWQFTIALVPQAWIDGGGNVDELFGEEGYDSTTAWKRHDDSRIGAALGGVLKETKSWHSDLRHWGDVQSDDIQAWCPNGKIESIRVRFDLRSPKIFLFREVVRIAQELELAIVSLGRRKLLSLEVSQLLRAAAESDAAHFCLDPSSFLLQVATINDRAT